VAYVPVDERGGGKRSALEPRGLMSLVSLISAEEPRELAQQTMQLGSLRGPDGKSGIV
jgi:hypothetical protein